MTAIFVTVSLIQGLLIATDEFYFHWKRNLPRWERIGHPIDSFLFALPLGILVFTTPTPQMDLIYVVLSAISCLSITKDEWIHQQQRINSFESWLHAVLFILHPVILFSAYFLSDSKPWFLKLFFMVVLVFGIHQFFFWNLIADRLRRR